MLYIGVDLGTSSIKLQLMDEEGNVKRTVSKEYPLEFPKPGWSQQNPEDWIKAFIKGVQELLEGFDASQVSAIGAGGQMHGLVVLDKDDNVIRPAILWNDGRTSLQVDYLNKIIGTGKLTEYTANIAFAGFTAPKILWMREIEPDLYNKIDKIMLPKDYLNYVLTGVRSTDVSDASGMLLFDVKNKCWSKEMLGICGIREEQMCTIFESYEKVGTVKPEMAKLLGIPESTIVAAGAGDNAAAAIGTGTVTDAACNISIGTSGTVFISCDDFCVDKNNSFHSFAHANGKYHLLGCMLSAASCNKWLLENILKTSNHDEEQAPITRDKLGQNHVFFLPYLMGERSPINDINARATFTGMTMDTSRADLVQAVLEGVAFAIRDCIEVAKKQGIRIERSNICGGGAKSPLWKDIFANVLNIKLDTVQSEEGPSTGGAMLAMVADGTYKNVEEVSNKFVKIVDTIEPDPSLVGLYEARYNQFNQLYPALKDVFTAII